MHALKLKCRPGAQFRLGAASLDRTDTHIHSDTLFSGLVSVWAMVYGEVETLVQYFRNTEGPTLSFSSAFYAVDCIRRDKDIKTVYFLPKPPVDIEMNDKTSIKKWKKVKYISWGIYRQLRKPKVSENGFGGLETKARLLDNVLLGSGCLCTAEELGISAQQTEYPSFVSTETSPKVHVHKVGDKDALYAETNLQFKDSKLDDDTTLRGHFYILVRHTLPDKDWQKVLACLRILAEEGIGGERSSGKGHIAEICEETDVEFPDDFSDTTARYRLSLSMLSPQCHEYDTLLFYQLITRGSWTLGREGIPARHRKQVRLVGEGAVLNSPAVGRVVDVKPEQGSPYPNIYRSGRGFCIPL